MDDIEIPDPYKEPTIDVPRAARLLGVTGRATAYDAAHRGEIPFIRVGRKMRVPTAKVLALLGLTP